MDILQNTNLLFSSIGNSLTPIEGPQSIGGTMRFATCTDPTDLRFILDQQTLKPPTKPFSMVQTVFIDLSQTDGSLIFRSTKSGQEIRCKGRTQGYYSVVAPNGWYFEAISSDANAVVPFQLLNYEVASKVWDAHS